MDRATDLNDLREKLAERIAWLKNESANGGDHEYLKNKWEETEYILSKLPGVDALTSRLAAMEGALTKGVFSTDAIFTAIDENLNAGGTGVDVHGLAKDLNTKVKAAIDAALSQAPECTCGDFGVHACPASKGQPHPTLVEQEAHWGEPDGGRPMHFRCRDCGPHVGVDDDGCCRECGADTRDENCGPECWPRHATPLQFAIRTPSNGLPFVYLTGDVRGSSTGIERIPVAGPKEYVAARLVATADAIQKASGCDHHDGKAWCGACPPKRST